MFTNMEYKPPPSNDQTALNTNNAGSTSRHESLPTPRQNARYSSFALPTSKSSSAGERAKTEIRSAAARKDSAAKDSAKDKDVKDSRKQQLQRNIARIVVKELRKAGRLDRVQEARESYHVQRLPFINLPSMQNTQLTNISQTTRRVSRDSKPTRNLKQNRSMKISRIESQSQQNQQLSAPRRPQTATDKNRDVSPKEFCISEKTAFNAQVDSIEPKEVNKNLCEVIKADDVVAKKSLGIALAEYSEKEIYFLLQRKVEEAIKNKKIFLIRGDIPYLEETLKKRGWMQKYESTKTRNVPYGSVASLDAPSLGNIHLPDGGLNEKYVIFNSLRHVPPDFIWDCRNDFIDWGGIYKQDTLLNRFERSFVYTSKLGLATILENVHWYHVENIASVQCPRSYNVAREKNAFLEDYRRTAAVSLLKWFVEQTQNGVELANKGRSPISPKQIEFAIKRCDEIVAEKNDEYLDEAEELISLQEWDAFIDDYIKAVHMGNGVADFRDFGTSEIVAPSLSMLYGMALRTLSRVKEVDPQYELNGIRNIWILKPSDLCCGAGITMTHKLSHIIKRIQDCTRDYFIVQKYIEKPLLVCDTKFDVRQWYLVTKSYPLTIWIYKESFLRCSSRPFTFETYHESVHICNTAVQNKYVEIKNSVRSQDWDCKKLNEYLKTVGFTGEPWYDEVYPKICQAIIATMLAAQEHMDKRKYSFELYGADFMIMDDLSVWLIEINTNPRMHPPSTRVTKRLYPEVLESLIKVVMDYPSNPNADTGDFVLAYEQNVADFQPYLGSCMYVLGKSVSTKPKVADFNISENT